jgi:hypothetical protein
LQELLDSGAYSRSPSLMQPSIIHTEHECVTLYLKNIDMLWELGIKPRREARAEAETSWARANRPSDVDSGKPQTTAEAEREDNGIPF